MARTFFSRARISTHDKCTTAFHTIQELGLHPHGRRRPSRWEEYSRLPELARLPSAPLQSNTPAARYLLSADSSSDSQYLWLEEKRRTWISYSCEEESFRLDWRSGEYHFQTCGTEEKSLSSAASDPPHLWTLRMIQSTVPDAADWCTDCKRPALERIGAAAPVVLFCSFIHQLQSACPYLVAPDQTLERSGVSFFSLQLT